MTKEDALNILIKDCDTNKISDGYHTFGELYEHRIILFILLCKSMSSIVSQFKPVVWRSRYHSDNTQWPGWFILGIGTEPGEQITYHLPDSDWDKCDFATDLEKAPDWDGHTSGNVLKRLAKFL